MVTERARGQVWVKQSQRQTAKVGANFELRPSMAGKGVLGWVDKHLRRCRELAWSQGGADVYNVGLGG